MAPLLAENIYDDDDCVIFNTIPDDRKAKKQLRVRFCERVIVKKVPSISTFSQEEVKSSWYSGKEMCVMRKMAENAIKSLSKVSKDSRRKKVCAHGLCTVKELRRQRKVRNEGLDAVLAEQGFQHLEGSQNEYRLADVYMTHTRENQMEAMERAHAHAERVKLLFRKADSSQKPARWS